MKTRLFSSRSLRACIPILVLVTCMGCATRRATYRFRITDAKSSKPLEDVKVTRTGFKRNLFTHYSKARDLQQLSGSNAQGEVIVESIDDREWTHKLSFSAGGYEDAALETDFISSGMVFRYTSPPDDLPTSQNVPPNAEGWFEIPLKRAATLHPTTAPERFN